MTDTLEHATDADLTAMLERDYRRQLRWYPGPWRAAHGDALIGTLMDEAEDTDRFTLERGEWRSFAAAGLATRLNRVVARPVRDAAATVLLGGGVGFLLVTSVVTTWTTWTLDSIDYPAAFGPFHDASPALAVLWMAALIAALAGRWWIGRIALLVSMLVAVLMHPIQDTLAPAHGFALDPGTLTLAFTSALITVLGSPRTRLPLVLATVAGTTLAAAASGYQALLGRSGMVSSPPAGVLFYDPVRTSGFIALALAVAVLFAIARFSTVAFTILLTVTSPAAALAASNLTVDVGFPPVDYLLICAPVAVGLVLLVLFSRSTAERSTRGWASSRAGSSQTEQVAHRRRATVTVAILVPVLVLGSTATAFAAAGLNWTRPAAVNWSNYWQTTINSPTSLRGEQIFASITYRLPSGGSCTTRFSGLEQLPNLAPDPAIRSARDYLTAASKDGTLLQDARISTVIAQQRTEDKTTQNFWGLPVRYGYGTANYNPDIEYVEAAQQGFQNAEVRHLQDAGFTNADTAFAWTHCTGMQQQHHPRSGRTGCQSVA